MRFQYDIGEKFTFRGKKYMTIENYDCSNCTFYCEILNCEQFYCSSFFRSDGKSVIYKPVPFKFGK